MPRYRVYVIELDRAVMQIRAFRERNPDARADKPCVYVGSTWLELEPKRGQRRELARVALTAREHSAQACPFLDAASTKTTFGESAA